MIGSELTYKNNLGNNMESDLVNMMKQDLD